MNTRTSGEKHLFPENSRESKGDDRLAVFRPQLSAASSGDDDVLLSVDLVSGRGRVSAGGEFVLPQNRAGVFVESADFFVRGRGDEDDTSRS